MSTAHDINPNRNQRQRYQDHQRPRDVAMDLFRTQHALVLAQEVADPRQDRAPHGGANGGIQDELGQRHPMQPAGMEMRWRITGNSRPISVLISPCSRKNFSERTKVLSLSKTYLP